MISCRAGIIGLLKFMKLKKFIKRLEKIREKRGEDLEVVMADYIPVVKPVFSSDEYLGDKVVITDEK